LAGLKQFGIGTGEFVFTGFLGGGGNFQEFTFNPFFKEYVIKYVKYK